MPSFQHFQSQAEQSSARPKFTNDGLSLSVILQYAESASKQGFDALCRLQPLVKTYRDKVAEVSVAMKQAESSLSSETEVPPSYSAAYSMVSESFALHLGALDEWTGALGRKEAEPAEQALAKVQQSGQQLQASLEQLSIGK